MVDCAAMVVQINDVCGRESADPLCKDPEIV